MELDLRATLYVELRNFAAARSLEVAWPNVEFERKNLREYLALATLPTNPKRIAVNTGESRHRWLVLLRFYVREGLGEMRSLEHAEALRAAYPADHIVRGVDYAFRVPSVASIRPPVGTEGWSFIPVELRFETFA